MLETITKMADASLRCIGFAYCPYKGDLPTDTEAWEFPEDNMTLLAIAGLKVSCFAVQYVLVCTYSCAPDKAVVHPCPNPRSGIYIHSREWKYILWMHLLDCKTLTCTMYYFTQDPCRPNVPRAVALCQRAGVKVPFLPQPRSPLNGGALSLAHKELGLAKSTTHTNVISYHALSALPMVSCFRNLYGHIDM